MSEQEHDVDCPGCETSRQCREEGGSIVRDYLAHCDQCAADIQGDTQHRIKDKTYCDDCAAAPLPKREK